MVERVQ